ncbi:MAG: S41 family peptidase [Bacteroidetes bacterium]|nr:S41 family peptidase [Bacteroidota bacterium]
MKNLSRKFKKAIIIILITVSVVISAGFVNKNFELTKNLDIFATLYRELFINYVDEINSAELIKTAIDSMLESLDPYTVFIPESEIEDYRFITTGQYGGIGAIIHYREKEVVITEPYAGFPAYKGGLVAGDVIVEVSGRSTADMDFDDVKTLLHGQPGSEVVLTVRKYGLETPQKVTLTREIIKVDNIPFYGMINEKTGYIKLMGFTQSASAEFKEAFMKLKQEHNLESLVIDLRGNGGGLLNEAVNIVNLFVDKDKTVVETKGRIEERNTVHKTLNVPIDRDIPIAVLTDRGSASASEIVAGAIQDFDRGVIIGERTFGKGLVQNIIPLVYNTQMKVTVAKYYIPSGRCIQAIDYAKKNEDGSIAEIPDSLKVAFKTANGRVVYDGGGLEPDVTVEKPYPANITVELIIQYMMFDYATKFFHENKAIASVTEFEITDNIYNDFISFVNGKNFSFKSLSEEKMDELIAAAKEDEYFENLEKYIVDLKQKVKATKEKDIYTHSSEIKRLLKDEIIGRYYYSRGRIEASLKADEDILEAINLLNNPERYKSVLSGK